MTNAERAVRLSDGAGTTLTQWGERGPLLLGVHGLGASRLGWARIGEHLADRYRVVAFDQRGHGDSARVGDMTFARSVADVGDVAAALGEPVHALLGHSWGGAVVIGAGRRLDVARVAAVEPMLVVESGVWARSVIPQYVELLGPPLSEREALIRVANAELPEAEIQAKLHAGRHIALEPIAALGAENGIDEGRWNFQTLLDGYPRPLWLAVAGQKRSVFSAADRAYARERG
ncbi:MAG: hypothetical protein QOI11_1123, partial [Candidatus Eremiobacteraeota bacterium]|nr:hypothetical protein [Candidatus Eremiobacteraeota bacterium]